jgi:hypothetical protein
MYNKTSFNLFSIIFSVVFEVLFGLMVVLAQNYVNHSKLTSHHLLKMLSASESIFVISVSVSFLLSLVTTVLNGYFGKHQLATSCRQISGFTYGGAHQMPEALMALILMYPMMLSMVVKSVKSEVVFMAWLINFVVIISLIAKYRLRLSLGPFMFVALISLLMLCEYQRQKISMFFLSQELRGTQTENERLEKENRQGELKHLIGNVAHDLKTVGSYHFFSFLILLCFTAPLVAEHGHRPDHLHSGGDKFCFGQFPNRNQNLHSQ